MKKNWTKSGTDKFIIIFNKKTILNENIKIIVKDIHSSFLFLVIFSKNMLLKKNFNKSRKIDVIPMLLPDIIS